MGDGPHNPAFFKLAEPHVNDMMMALGLESWKSVVGALLLPPVPFLVLVLVGARLMFRRRLLAWSLILLAVAGIWMTSVPALGVLMRQGMHPVPPALTDADIATLCDVGNLVLSAN